MEIRAILHKIEPFIAIAILVFLVFSSTMLYKEQIIKKEISENCGWGDEDFYCICEKSQASQLKNLMDGDSNLENVSLVR